ncbi:Crp/Fnr family transcriptional regulator [Novosphingobium sp. 9U]|uniref:Crp/Fnr family transcriptional regulator n=1 Tax=Novosphingobium sp. 9U TaxID=2653158 RepID=UPI0012F3A408|nr:Crp/Fnr family transcriptional regulator [Novosphingobium sp. 9U]VWX54434.1 Crp/Fnr family transcriptional regulator [Novosphingobium sp. 9U]
MSISPDAPFGRVIRKLERLVQLGPAERDAIQSLPFKRTDVLPGHYLVREGQVPVDCCILLNGYACRHKTTSSGGRQIVSFHIPGDILDLQHVVLPRADHNVQTISSATVAWVPAAEIKRLALANPVINEALWRDALIDSSIFREWVLNVGRRDAKARIAHMLCEFAARRQAAGLGSTERFELPMSQQQIADATGLTTVHVNRTLFELEREGVISRDKRHVEIANWRLMCQVADFDPAYLHAAV